MADQKHEESFKVVDRRLFTPEGELRKEVLEQERREAETAAVIGKRPAPSGTPKRVGDEPSSPKDSASSARLEQTASTRPYSDAAEVSAPSRNFQMLVDFLARNAAVLLGGYADPRTGQAVLDLDGARELIDMLDVLCEKTRGNLAPEDDRLLVDVLGSLKLSFLEMSKAAAQAMREKAKAKT